MRIVLSAVIGSLLAATAWAHSGGTSASGCHHNLKTGGYHCHNPKSSSQSSYKTPLDHVGRSRAAPIDKAVARPQSPASKSSERQKKLFLELQSARSRAAQEIYDWEWQQYLKDWREYQATPAILRGPPPLPPEPLALRRPLIEPVPPRRPPPKPPVARRPPPSLAETIMTRAVKELALKVPRCRPGQDGVRVTRYGSERLFECLPY